jgi:hypothetical protein
MAQQQVKVVCVLRVAEAEFLIAAQAQMLTVVSQQAGFLPLWERTATAASCATNVVQVDGAHRHMVETPTVQADSVV